MSSELRVWLPTEVTELSIGFMTFWERSRANLRCFIYKRSECPSYLRCEAIMHYRVVVIRQTTSINLPARVAGGIVSSWMLVDGAVIFPSIIFIYRRPVHCRYTEQEGKPRLYWPRRPSRTDWRCRPRYCSRPCWHSRPCQVCSSRAWNQGCGAVHGRRPSGRHTRSAGGRSPADPFQSCRVSGHSSPRLQEQCQHSRVGQFEQQTWHGHIIKTISKQVILTGYN